MNGENTAETLLAASGMPQPFQRLRSGASPALNARRVSLAQGRICVTTSLRYGLYGVPLVPEFHGGIHMAWSSGRTLRSRTNARGNGAPETTTKSASAASGIGRPIHRAASATPRAQTSSSVTSASETSTAGEYYGRGAPGDGSRKRRRAPSRRIQNSMPSSRRNGRKFSRMYRATSGARISLGTSSMSEEVPDSRTARTRGFRSTAAMTSRCADSDS